jgi:hypothetical protein
VTRAVRAETAASRRKTAGQERPLGWRDKGGGGGPWLPGVRHLHKWKGHRPTLSHLSFPGVAGLGDLLPARKLGVDSDLRGVLEPCASSLPALLGCEKLPVCTWLSPWGLPPCAPFSFLGESRGCCSGAMITGGYPGGYPEQDGAQAELEWAYTELSPLGGLLEMASPAMAAQLAKLTPSVSSAVCPHAPYHRGTLGEREVSTGPGAF